VHLTLHYIMFITLQLKMIWYLFMSVIEDEYSQQKGVVYVAYGVGASMAMAAMDSELVWRGSQIPLCLPIRFAGFHFCFNNQLLPPMMAAVQLGVGKNVRARFRTHYGMYSLCVCVCMSVCLYVCKIPFFSCLYVRSILFLSSHSRYY
jgi:hypothetical protein